MMGSKIAELENGTLTSGWKTPVNIAAEAEGSIHNDETAQELGLEGGWIAGSIHMEQFAPLLMQRFGETWLNRGTLSVYFRNATVSGQSVNAFVGPLRSEENWAEVKMENEKGEIVCDGVAYQDATKDPTPLRLRLNRDCDRAAGPILKSALQKETVRAVPSRIYGDRLRRDLPGVTAPLPDYAEGVLPANLAIDALRVVEPHLVSMPENCVGLYGGIQLEMVDGPVMADTDYECDGRVLSLGQTPRTETLWYASELHNSGRVVARMTMLSRIMQL